MQAKILQEARTIDVGSGGKVPALVMSIIVKTTKERNTLLGRIDELRLDIAKRIHHQANGRLSVQLTILLLEESSQAIKEKLVSALELEEVPDINTHQPITKNRGPGTRLDYLVHPTHRPKKFSSRHRV